MTGDTVCQTIIIEDEISLFIPNLSTPNGDGASDDFVISFTGASLSKSLKVAVFKRWGQKVESRNWESGTLGTATITDLVIWDFRTTAGSELPENTYYYVGKHKGMVKRHSSHSSLGYKTLVKVETEFNKLKKVV
jgi:gliding motility-associated-like protein